MLAGCAASALALGALIAAPALYPSAEAQAGATAAQGKPIQGKIGISVLSSRYDLVSGGDALVEVRASEGAKASELKLTLNGRELTAPLKFDHPVISWSFD